MNVDVGGCVRDRRPRHASQGDDEGIRVFRRAALLRTETPPITAIARQRLPSRHRPERSAPDMIATTERIPVPASTSAAGG